MFNSFTTALNTLCKTLPILFDEGSTPFHSLCARLILSRIYNLAHLALMSRCKYFPYQISSRAFILIDPPSDSLSVYYSSIESIIDAYSATFSSFPTKLPSSNYTKVIILPVFSWDDVLYRIYENSGHTTSASEYGRDPYYNQLEKFLSNKTPRKETLYVH